MHSLIKISKYAGAREDLIQAGGGNTSVKLLKDKMLIKSSGYQLTEVTSEAGFSEINTTLVVEYLEKALSSTEEECDILEKEALSRSLISGQRPSIETFLHAVTDKVTLHTHPVVVNILVSQEKGFDKLKQLFPKALYIDYATPGIKLAKLYYQAFKEKQEGTDTRIIFLRNHGLIVSGSSAEEVIDLNETVITKIANYLKCNNNGYSIGSLIQGVFPEIDGMEDKICYYSKNKEILQYMSQRRIEEFNHAICPDSIVYCGKKVLFIQDIANVKEEIKNHIQHAGMPNVIIFKENVYLVANTVRKAKEIESLLAFTMEVLLFNQNEKVLYLSEQEQDFLLNWDSEKYRKNMK